MLFGVYSLGMVVWTCAVLGVLYACVLYFVVCTCSAQFSMFHMERRTRKKIVVVALIQVEQKFVYHPSWMCCEDCKMGL